MIFSFRRSDENRSLNLFERKKENGERIFSDFENFYLGNKFDFVSNKQLGLHQPLDKESFEQ